MFDPIRSVDEITRASFHSQTIEGGLAERALDAFAEVGRNIYRVVLQRALQRSLELALSIGSIELCARNPNPRAAPRRPRPDVGGDGSIRAEREPDQFVARALTAREDARPFRDVHFSLQL
jgi:hypothetical protein